LGGYPFMWIAAGTMALLSVPALAKAVSAYRAHESPVGVQLAPKPLKAERGREGRSI
jgi:hypothetical protein